MSDAYIDLKFQIKPPFVVLKQFVTIMYFNVLTKYRNFHFLIKNC